MLIGAIALLGAAVALGVGLFLPSGAGGTTEVVGLAGGGAARPKQSGISSARNRVVDSATKFVDREGGRGLQHRLEQSGSQLRSGEWVLLVAAATLVLGFVVFLTGDFILTGLAIVFVPTISWMILSRNITKRQEAFADQLPDFLQNLTSALRSGQSLTQAIASIAPDLESPAGDELRRVVIENRIGRDLIESFRDLARRMDSMDFDWVVRAIDINYRTGGDLSVILRRLDSTIRARNHVAGTVRALSAEGRISGKVLAALPPLLMAAVQVVNPGFMDPLFNTSLGRLLLIVATTQLIIGTIWLNNMAKFKF